MIFSETASHCSGSCSKRESVEEIGGHAAIFEALSQSLIAAVGTDAAIGLEPEISLLFCSDRRAFAAAATS
jgi:hypothetical protein